MGLLTKLKSLLGLDEDRSQVRRTDSGVTIEREPEESAEPDAETESAVKGVDTGGEVEESFEAEEPTESDDSDAETGISTEDIADVPDEEDEETRVQDATEPAETTQPSTDAGQPTQTEGTEPEPSPEPTEDESLAEEDEPVAEADEAADEPVGEGEPLEDIKGIGPAYAERLRDAGVPDIAALAKADAEQLALETDLSEKRISTWIERAQAR